ncbi:uncharacterized protein KY384_002803 [Bacidia gigantensis]|uniref:uncharacterized protein n=1 Tax=Bacidia gigantensis TaxID=2732470 RepID=UPI001D05B4A6|nr:uncharacterized protein KY384_002803 [Bacidia gigantensis]KAG8532925.1 hypothetical protein KY384_002803 [Bacidia gigantensis]
MQLLSNSLLFLQLLVLTAAMPAWNLFSAPRNTSEALYLAQDTDNTLDKRYNNNKLYCQWGTDTRMGICKNVKGFFGEKYICDAACNCKNGIPIKDPNEHEAGIDK